MIKREKIEEWIKEVGERPSSAPVILQYVANRLRDLTKRNEELLAEVIELQSGKRVEEYEKRIGHLEYQLELLKRQVGGEVPLVDEGRTGSSGRTGSAAGISGVQPASFSANAYSVLVYDGRGRVLRVEAGGDAFAENGELGMIHGDLAVDQESPRLLAVPGNEELLFVFSTGRIATAPVSGLPLAKPVAAGERGVSLKQYAWDETAIPNEPHGGESLACLAPISRLALAEHFVQSSRRGFLKKIRIGMADSILQNRYIGAGVKKAPDRTFDVLLVRNDERIALVTWEGYLLCLEVKSVPISIEEVIRLGVADHLAAAFILPEGASLLAMTSAGKSVHFTSERIEVATSFKTRGQAIYSGQRRSQGVRVVGAAAAKEADWAVILDRAGRLSLHSMSGLFGSGTLPEGVEPLAFGVLTASSGGM